MDRALCSSSMSRSTSTVRNTSWRRSMDANRGEGAFGSLVTRAVYGHCPFPQYHYRVLTLNFFTASSPRIFPNFHNLAMKIGLHAGPVFSCCVAPRSELATPRLGLMRKNAIAKSTAEEVDKAMLQKGWGPIEFSSTTRESLNQRVKFV
jgi:hypothetical protein